MEIKLPEFVEKVVIERNLLNEKIKKLSRFIVGEESNHLTECEKKMLNEQLAVMVKYEKILTERISYYVVKEMEKE